MKFLAAVLSGVVGVGVLLMSGPAMAGVSDRVDPVQRRATADVTAPVATLPGTDAEATEYERREAQSPEVQEFAGGDVVVGVSVLVLVIIVVLIVLLVD